jgi:S-adenosyl-L-methionine hydrolase (adenosine-forming)
VARGAAVLADTVSALPPAVHVAVVDPGVGTARRAVALRTPDGFLVGPDNGLLPWAADALGGVATAVELRSGTEEVRFHTFHGRDVFCPAAARLARGADVAGEGPPLDPATLVRLPDPMVRHGKGWVEAEVRTVDRFGNVQLAATDAAGLDGALRVGGTPAVRGRTFADAQPGGLVVLIDSAGRLAVAADGASAADLLRVGPGDVVRIEKAGQLRQD